MNNSQEIIPVNINPSELDHFSKILSSPSACKSEILQVLQVIKGFALKPGIDYSSLILSDIVYKLIILVMDKDYEIIKDTSLIICNLACGKGDITTYMMERGVTEVLVKVMGSDLDISENAIWSIGNLAVDSKENCEIIKNSGFFKKLLQYLNDFHELPFQIVSISLWSCSNIICKLKQINSSEAKEIMQLVNITKNCISEEKLAFEWIRLTYNFLNKSDVASDMMIEHNLALRVIRLIERMDCKAREYALLAVGVMIYSNDKNAQILISFGILDILNSTFYTLPKDHYKIIYWIISNIAGGTAAQAQQLIHHQLFTQVISKLAELNPYLQKELSIILQNLSLHACLVDLIHLIEQKFIAKVLEILPTYSNEAKNNLLKFIYNCLLAIFKAERLELLEDLLNTGTLEKIEEYTQDKDESIKKTAGLIYFKLRGLFSES